MRPITELPNIAPAKTHALQEILDELLARRIISGYNWYESVPQESHIVTFSHMHETELYKTAMIQDLQSLGYAAESLKNSFRDKFGSYRWERDFVFRDDTGALFPDLHIRKMREGYLDLTKYPSKTLEGIAGLGEGQLVGENAGWELDVPFHEKANLFALVNLFISKSSKKNPDHWPGAYEVPVLLLGEAACAHAEELPDFIEARKISLVERGNEVSFVVNQRLPQLRSLPQYVQLQSLGFKELRCLGNRAFIASYVDS